MAKERSTKVINLISPGAGVLVLRLQWPYIENAIFFFLLVYNWYHSILIKGDNGFFSPNQNYDIIITLLIWTGFSGEQYDPRAFVIYSMIGLLICKYEPFWQDVSVQSLIHRWDTQVTVKVACTSCTSKLIL